MKTRMMIKIIIKTDYKKDDDNDCEHNNYGKIMIKIMMMRMGMMHNDDNAFNYCYAGANEDESQ